tara:strand:- start:3372 stop:3527 length:156 start_codon:yes stop_codon:yes gene_type:complete
MILILKKLCKKEILFSISFNYLFSKNYASDSEANRMFFKYKELICNNLTKN